MYIIKFGGSSVGNPDRIKSVINIIKSKKGKKIPRGIVFSAYHGITDKIISSFTFASNGNKKYLSIVNEIIQIHRDFAAELIPNFYKNFKNDHINNLLYEFNELLNSIYLIREVTPKTKDYLLSFGERLSAYTISLALKENGFDNDFLDARNIIITNRNFNSAKVLYKPTFEKIREHFKKNLLPQVITGFIGSTIKNETTTLGRGGSDYTASIIGAALDADEIEIWTDVNGVLTADPRKVQNAFSLNSLSYEEAMELSHFGAKVIYPPTMQPAMKKNIPINIKNTFNPEFPGTIISRKTTSSSYLIKGISSIDDIALVRVQGSGMIGVSGIAGKIFNALAKKEINIILITQASSEHTLCFAILPEHKESAKEAIEEELKWEIRDGLINEILIEDKLSIIAVVGENMRQTPGIAGKIFQTLGNRNINISAIAQGSSELNISLVIKKSDEVKALNVIHSSFFENNIKTFYLFIWGIGLIGKKLLELLEAESATIEKKYGVKFTIRALSNSKKMLLSHQEISLKKIESYFNNESEIKNDNKFLSFADNFDSRRAIFVDCSSSEDVVELYLPLIKKGISIVTPNKKANSRSVKYYNQLHEEIKKHDCYFGYETNVGASLPVISTLKDLISGGDKIEKIEGQLSGTLSYLFSTFDGSIPFSELVYDALQKGYTEPDPRNDLNGDDAKRKLLILAREAGYLIDEKNIKVQSLVPSEAEYVSIKKFFLILKKYDNHFLRLFETAKKKNERLRYIARFIGKRGTIKLASVNSHHPFYYVEGNESIIAFYTKYFNDKPLIIRGKGAGAYVTASGVIADLLKATRYLIKG